VTDYLNGKGSSVVTFERITASLATGTIPTKGQCQAVAKILESGDSPNPDALEPLIQGITDLPLQVEIRQDLQNKLLLLSSCLASTTTSKETTAAHTTSQVVMQELKGLGITY
jgi:hypothetical protein